MPSSFLGRLTSRTRRSLGTTELSDRLSRLEARLDQISGQVTDLASRQYSYGPVYFGDNSVLVPTRWGTKMLVDVHDIAIAPWLTLQGSWEADLTGWIQANLHPGDVFVDVGANTGYFTLLAGSIVGETGRVFAIEAHPRLAGLLRRNVVMNGLHGWVSVVHRAAWSSDESLSFYLRSTYAGNSSVGRVSQDVLDWFGDTEESVSVQGITVDEVLEGQPKVDVLKIDVEGAEVRALAGLGKTMDANPGMRIIFEWSPAHIEGVGDPPEALLDLLLERGYTFRVLATDEPVGRDELVAIRYTNVLAEPGRR